MNGDERSDREQRGPIVWMARNSVAANVLMLFLLIAGLIAAGNLTQEVLPDISLNRIQAIVPYPGASPGEVEESVVRKIEEQIRLVEGVERVEATASEGLGSVVAEFKWGANMDRALNAVKAEVDRIATFPAGSERPEVREITSRTRIIRLLVYGDAPERTLKELAVALEEGISLLPEVSLAETSGARPYEISIEIPQSRLRALGLSLEDVALAVRQGSLDLSAGKISAGEEEILVRTLGQNYEQGDFEDIIVLVRPDGTSVRLGDVATVRDGFADTDLSVRYDGQPAVRVDVYRTSDEQVLAIAEAVNDYLAREVMPALPNGVGVAVWADDSKDVGGRLALMVENALLGLFLVFIALALFLHIRLALWVAIGLVVSFAGTFLAMELLGVSINMFSLVGLVLALGIVVDDAIVVGESIYSERERGVRGLTAAIRGTRRVSSPVIFSVFTTVAAFAALLFVPGTQAQLGLAIPMVVIAVLMLSLVESLLVLPNHLAHLPDSEPGQGRWWTRMLDRARGGVDALLKRIADGPLERALRFGVAQPWIVIAGALGLIILSISVVASGIVPNQFVTPIEGNVVSATLEMPVGTSSDRTAQVVAELEAAGHRAAARISEDASRGGEPLNVGVMVTMGETVSLYDPLGGDAVDAARSHLGSVQFKLIDWERHGVAASAFQQAWREEVGTIPEAQSLSISSNIVALGLPVHFELSHPDPEQLTVIAEKFAGELRAIDGVFDVRSNLDEGFGEIQLELKPEARTLALTLDRFASQARAAFFGVEALRVQRGREDMRVYVRLPEEERDSEADIDRYIMRTPGGGVPLGQVANARFARSPSAIRRVDGRRAVTVTADVDVRVASGPQVNALLEQGVLARMAARYPAFDYAFGGERKQQAEANNALGRLMSFALLVMYVLMAISFGSYMQPLIIMAAVPLGLVGVVAGHMVLGISIGIWSMYGLVGVSGVVVNDALMMIKRINELRKSGMAPEEAIITGARNRFRAILLTSVTTFAGVTPLILETSTYAQHLVPLATSVGFGVLFATILLIPVAPALVAVHYRLLPGR